MASTRRLVAVLGSALVLNVAAAPAFAHEADSLSPAPPPAAPPPMPLTPVGPADAHPTAWPWVLVGAGALTLGTGVWLVGRDHGDPSMPVCTTSPIGRTTCPYSTATQWQGWAFVALGAQLAIAGVAWRVYEVRHAKKSITVVAGLGGVSGTF